MNKYLICLSVFLNLLYVVSSSGVKNYSLFEELKKVRDEDIEIRLQFSCHTTDNEQRRILSPRLDMFSLEEISEVVENWYDENQKVTLNFVPFKKFELSSSKIVDLFDPKKVFIKISYVDFHDFVKKEGLLDKEIHQIQDFVESLRNSGFNLAYRNK